MTVEQIEQALREALPHVRIYDVKLTRAAGKPTLVFSTPNASCATWLMPDDTPESIASKAQRALRRHAEEASA